MSNTYKELGNRVRFYRKAKGITTSELSSRIGISIDQLSNIENGNYDIFKLELLNKLLKELSISLGELINPNSLDLMDFDFQDIENKVILPSSYDESINNIHYINQYLNALIIAFLATASEFKDDSSKIKEVTNHLIEELHFIKDFYCENSEKPNVSTM